jgi:hypothetical protein
MKVAPILESKTGSIMKVADGEDIELARRFLLWNETARLAAVRRGET